MPSRQRARAGSLPKPASDPLPDHVERVLHRHGLEEAMKLLMDEKQLLEIDELKTTI